MDVIKEIKELGLSIQEYEDCLTDITEKMNGTLDIDWQELKDKYNIPYSADSLRKANGTVFGGFAVREFLREMSRHNSAHTKQILDVRMERQKLYDERAALNKIKREDARLEQDIENLAELIKSHGRRNFPPIEVVRKNTGRDMIICVSDVHFGQDVNSYGGKYNAETAENRFVDYLQNIKAIQEFNKCENAYVFLLGDLISGNIHLTTRLENRENVVEQIMQVSELISNFVYEVSKMFDTVHINDVVGNHSRIDIKKNVLRNERLDSIVPWYVKANLSHLDNILWEEEQNYDSTIGSVTIRGKEYLLVHGDFDAFSKSGVSNLIMMIGHIPEGVFYGHLHHNSYDDINNVKIIRSGSFCGTGDDYCVSKRLHNKPSQMICIADDDGLKTFYPIILSV